MLRHSLTIAILCALAAPAVGADATTAGLRAADAVTAAALPRVDVVGSGDQAKAQPGSAQVLDAIELRSSRVLSVNEALRKVTGVNVRDEEGFGLRPNIGVRGLNPTRSTKVLLLEDGIPAAYAPYGDNASYYHAPIDRYEQIEVLKGVGMLRFGPQTIGGIINYITPVPPEQFGGRLEFGVGNRGYGKVGAQLGGNGHLFDAMRKRGDGARDNQDLQQTDFNYKFQTTLGDVQDLVLRAHYLEEDSQVTYSGLTDAEYRLLGARYNPFENDHFDIERYGMSATHSVALGSAMLDTNLYYFEFHRDWWRQSSTTTDSQCGSAFTNARLAGQRVDADTCQSVQGRLRDYTSRGVEPRLSVEYRIGGVEAALETGLRFHRETQQRIQRNGTTPTARTGTIAENNRRETEARAAFVQNRFDFGRFALVPAVRFENVDYERQNRLTNARGETGIDEWIPGLGATFALSAETTLFAGIHEGFAPPRTEDIISNSGTSVDVDAEHSTNVELGVRSAPRPGVNLEATLFRNNFHNQIAVGSIAGGNLPLAEGEAVYEGAEFAAQLDFGEFAEVDGNPYLRVAYTALPTAEQHQPFVRVDNGQAVPGSAAGRRMPYAPRNTATSKVGYSRGEWDASVELVYVGAQYADFANTAQPAANGNGQFGRIGGYSTWNLAVNYSPADTGWTVFAAVKNAGDHAYIADRTRGILPGSPRQFHAGFIYTF